MLTGCEPVLTHIPICPLLHVSPGHVLIVLLSGRLSSLSLAFLFSLSLPATHSQLTKNLPPSIYFAVTVLAFYWSFTLRSELISHLVYVGISS